PVGATRCRSPSSRQESSRMSQRYSSRGSPSFSHPGSALSPAPASVGPHVGGAPRGLRSFVKEILLHSDESHELPARIQEYLPYARGFSPRYPSPSNLEV